MWRKKSHRSPWGLPQVSSFVLFFLHVHILCDFFGLMFFMMSFQIRLEYRDMDQPQRHASGDFRFSSKEKEDMFTKPVNYRKEVFTYNQIILDSTGT